MTGVRPLLRQSRLPALHTMTLHGTTGRQCPGDDHPEDFNQSFTTGTPEEVERHRRYLAAQAGFAIDQLTRVRQVHGSEIVRVSRAEAGAGALEPGSPLGQADGLITNDTDVVLAVLTADCVPVCILDRFNLAIGLFHSGWRGTLDNIAGRGLRRMQREFGTRPDHCSVWLGPAICGDCYQLGREISERFLKAFPEAKAGIDMAEGHVDLRHVIACRLQDMGVIEVDSCPVCTFEDDNSFSYRREGTGVGHMISVLALR